MAQMSPEEELGLEQSPRVVEYLEIQLLILLCYICIYVSIHIDVYMEFDEHKAYYSLW